MKKYVLHSHRAVPEYLEYLIFCEKYHGLPDKGDRQTGRQTDRILSKDDEV